MNIKFTYDQSQGSRQYQQDDAVHFIEKNGKQWFVVADGLGWHNDSDTASQYAVDYIQTIDTTMASIMRMDGVAAAFYNINKDLNEAWSTIGRGQPKPATTMTAVYIQNNQAYCYWTGDSPAYIYDKEGNFHLIGGYGHAYSDGALMYCLGADSEPKTNYSVTELNEGDKILVGSDGILPYIITENVPTCAKDVVDYCAPLKGSDNVTCFLVEV